MLTPTPGGVGAGVLSAEPALCARSCPLPPCSVRCSSVSVSVPPSPLGLLPGTSQNVPASTRASQPAGGCKDGVPVSGTAEGDELVLFLTLRAHGAGAWSAWCQV